MGKTLVLDIDFSSPTQEYYAGEAISGFVVVHLEKPMPLKEIQVEFKGSVKCIWSRGTNNYHVCIITCLHAKIVIDISSNSEVSGAGLHRFPFSSILPNSLPESYESTYGQVRYEAIATVQSAKCISFLSRTCTKQQRFIIRASLPIPFQLGELKVIDESHPLPCLSSFCLCWSLGKISAKMTTNKGGYLAGEAMAFKAEIENNSSEDLDNVTLVLMQAITYLCKYNDQITSRMDITKAVSAMLAFPQELRSHGAVTWSEFVRVPLNISPTNLGGSSIIEINYYLQLEVGKDDGCCAPKVLFKFPLMIGSVRPNTIHVHYSLVN